MNIYPKPQNFKTDGHTHKQAHRATHLIPTGFQPSSQFSACIESYLTKCYPGTLSLSSDSAPRSQNIQLSITDQPAQSYKLTIEPREIKLSAGAEVGLFYGLQSLAQIFAQTDEEIPRLIIDDFPDLKARGFMLDISRCKVPKMETLFDLIDCLAGLRYNQLQLYTEHTFAYSGHQQVWQDASPLTSDETQELDTYCKTRFIELIPNQNSFGHMERWLRHSEYRHLAECPNGYKHWAYGELDHGGTLKPNDASIEFLDHLYSEFLPNFTSNLFNIGGDEPWELGQGWSRAKVEKDGKHRVYVDFLKKIHRLVISKGKRMQFWGDIVLEEPDHAQELPADVLAMVWGYEADHPFEEQCQTFKNTGTDFYVCPGTSTWNTIGGRYQNMAGNISSAIKNAIRFGAEGILLTDWGDHGHHQSICISFPGIAWAGNLSWNGTNSRPRDIMQMARTGFPEIATEEQAQSIYQLGLIADSLECPIHNATILNKILFSKAQDIQADLEKLNTRSLDNCRQTLADIRNVHHGLDTPLDRELSNAAALLEFACVKGLSIARRAPINAFGQKKMLDPIIEQFEQNWLTRNRPGGLAESVSNIRKPLSSF